MKHTWYSDESCRKVCEKFVQDHPEKDLGLLRNIATSGDLEDLRILCNCLYVHEYTPKDFYNLSYNVALGLQKLCSFRIHDMLGGLDSTYNQLFKIWKSERWGGDESWKLLCDARKSFEEARAILTLVDLTRYLGQPLTLTNLQIINDLYSHGRSGNLYVENLYSFNLDVPSEFEEANRRVTENVKRWRKFMSHLWKQDFKSCRDMIDQYDEERRNESM